MKLFSPIFGSIAWILKHVGTMLDTMLTTFNPSVDNDNTSSLFLTHAQHYFESRNKLSHMFNIVEVARVVPANDKLESMRLMLKCEVELYDKILEKLDNALVNIANNNMGNLIKEFIIIQDLIYTSFTSSNTSEYYRISQFSSLLAYLNIGYEQSKLLLSAWKALEILEINESPSNLVCVSNTSYPPIVVALSKEDMDLSNKALESIRIIAKLDRKTTLCTVVLSRSLITQEELFKFTGNDSIIDFIMHGSRLRKSIYFCEMKIEARIKMFMGRKLERLVTVMSALKVKHFDTGLNLYRFPSILTETTLLTFLEPISKRKDNSFMKITDFIKAYILITSLGIYIGNRRGNLINDSRKLDDKAFNIIDKRLFTAASGPYYFYCNYTSPELQRSESNQITKRDCELAEANRLDNEFAYKGLYPELPPREI